jgi:uncharacterized protein (DUF1697 family)
MPRYVALLRGVSPMNAKMAELRAAFEAAGFENVKTVLASGNVVFDARSSSAAALEKKCEKAMQDAIGRSFMTFVRRQADLQKLLDADLFARHPLPPKAKRVVSFVRAVPDPQPKLPVEFEGARILALEGRELYTAYVPQQANPAFMTLIEKTFGKAVTTRTWETVGKCAGA